MTPRHLTSAFLAIATLSLSCGADPFSNLAARTPAVERDGDLRAEAREIAAVLALLPTRLDAAEEARTAAAVVAEAHRAGLPAELVLALIQVESSGNAFAVSHVGAMGLMQLRPSTAEDVANRLGMRWTGDAMLFDPVANVRLGVEYLRSLVDRYEDIPTALAAYNWGPSRIARKMRSGEAVPAAYSSRVLATYHETAI